MMCFIVNLCGLICIILMLNRLNFHICIPICLLIKFIFLKEIIVLKLERNPSKNFNKQKT